MTPSLSDLAALRAAGLFGPVDHPRIERAVREILLAVGEDPDREGLQETPARVARTLQRLPQRRRQTPGPTLPFINLAAAHLQLQATA